MPYAPRCAGLPVALTFMDSLCKHACPIEGRELAVGRPALPAANRPTIVMVSVDPGGDDTRRVQNARAKWSSPAERSGSLARARS